MHVDGGQYVCRITFRVGTSSMSVLHSGHTIDIHIKKMILLYKSSVPVPLFFNITIWKNWVLSRGGGGIGGNSDYFLTGCAARGLKPLPISKDFSPSKMTDLTFWNFRKSESISKGFCTSKMANFTFFCNFCKMGPSSKDFFWGDQNGTNF